LKNKTDDSLINIGLIREGRKKKGLSYERFVKEIYGFSSGICSMSVSQARTLELGVKNTRVNPYILYWIMAFLNIKPNDFFRYKD